MLVSSSMLPALLVFLLAAAIDVAFVGWMYWSERGRRHLAALASTAVGALGVLGTVLVVKDLRLIVVDLAGLYAGTWVALWLRTWAERRNPRPGALVIRLPTARLARPGKARRRPAGFVRNRTEDATASRAA